MYNVVEQYVEQCPSWPETVSVKVMKVTTSRFLHFAAHNTISNNDETEAEKETTFQPTLAVL